jgi:hypothetical protein
MSAVVQFKFPERKGKRRGVFGVTGEVVKYPTICRLERHNCQTHFVFAAEACGMFVDVRRLAQKCAPSGALKGITSLCRYMRRIKKKKKVQDDEVLCAAIGDILQDIDELRHFLKHWQLRKGIYTYRIEHDLFGPLQAILDRMEKVVGSLNAPL